MEHKLVTGGEQYLPFARSRIKALRATGLEYASQQFEMGDASVKVRIAGEHEYINLSGGSGVIWMLVSVSELPGSLAEVLSRYPLAGSLVQSDITMTKHSRLFILDRRSPMDAKKAKQVYHGTTPHRYFTQIAYGNLDPNTGEPENGYYSKYSYTPSNLYGSISGFAPYGGKALTWKSSHSLDDTRFQTGNGGGPAEENSFTRVENYTTVFRWKSSEFSFTLNNISSVGERLALGYEFPLNAPATVPMFIETRDKTPSAAQAGLAVFNTFDFVNFVHGTPNHLNHYKFYTDANAPVTDPEGAVATRPLPASSTPYSARAVNSNTQGHNFIFIDNGDGPRLYDRKMNLIAVANPHTVSISRELYLTNATDGPALAFQLWRHTAGGTLPNKLDLSKISELKNDPAFADFFGQTQLTPGFVFFFPPPPFPGETIKIMDVQFLVDQKYLFDPLETSAAP